MSVAIFLPVRRGSERVKNKNSKDFAGKRGGLLQLKLEQLQNVALIDEIILSSNDPVCLKIANDFSAKCSKLKVYERPDNLGHSSTLLEDLIKHVPLLTECDNILWTHVTSPFCTSIEYNEVINFYLNSMDRSYDSLITGKIFKDYLLDIETMDIINNKSKTKWPRTQDLEELFEITNGVFLCSRKNMLLGDRMGKTPYFYDLKKLASIDIDDEEDFKIAEILYGQLYK